MCTVTTDRPDWDTYFIGIAWAVSARADCRRQQFGCVIVNQNRIVSTGYNGAPSGPHPGFMKGNQDFSNCIALLLRPTLWRTPRASRPKAALYISGTSLLVTCAGNCCPLRECIASYGHRGTYG